MSFRAVTSLTWPSPLSSLPWKRYVIAHTVMLPQPMDPLVFKRCPIREFRVLAARHVAGRDGWRKAEWNDIAAGYVVEYVPACLPFSDTHRRTHKDTGVREIMLVWRCT